MRLDKLLAHSGFGTRKEVKDIIKKGYDREQRNFSLFAIIQENPLWMRRN